MAVGVGVTAPWKPLDPHQAVEFVLLLPACPDLWALPQGASQPAIGKQSLYFPGQWGKISGLYN